MAKFDEKDPRWIVEDREDGTNVKNWHWTEKDCTAWSKRRLTELLTRCPLGQNETVSVEASGLRSLTGEAFINNRKNKVFASFELNLKIEYIGVVKDGEGMEIGKGEGLIEVPNLSDEQDTDDWEFRIVPSTEDKAGHHVKDAVLKWGRKKLRSVLSTFVKELRSGVPADKQQPGEADATPSEAVLTREKESEKEAHGEATTADRGFHELRLVEKYHANPQDIFDCFTVAGKLQAFSQSPATVDARVDGGFSWFDGAVSGRFIEIDRPKKLVMDWRFNNWTEEHCSRVVLTMESPESGLTVLSLYQSKIPEEDNYGHANVLAVTEHGWRNQVLTRIKAVFGYGI